MICTKRLPSERIGTDYLGLCMDIAGLWNFDYNFKIITYGIDDHAIYSSGFIFFYYNEKIINTLFIVLKLFKTN